MKRRSPRQADEVRESSEAQLTSAASRKDFFMESFGRIEDAGRNFDVAFWQRLGDAAIYDAAWELVEFYLQSRGMSAMDCNFKDLLNLFNEHEVRYLVVGAYAVMKHTEPRFTKDLDVWTEATPENARAVFEALREFGAPLSGITAEDFALEGLVYQMGQPPLRIDVLTSIDSVKFADAWPERVDSDFGGVPAPILSRRHLIANKRAVGRPQDLVDLGHLLDSAPPEDRPKIEA